MEPLSEDDPGLIGPYRVVGVLGEGGMGRVYLGIDDDGVEVAVKVVHADLARDREYRKRFARETAAAGRMRGPFIAAVLASDPEARRPWLATEYVPAASLWASVAEDGPLPVERVRQLGGDLAEALSAVHAAELVHRDVKPSNVLLGADGPRLIDFGIARDLAQSTMTRTGMLLGTPAFMAPEQVADRAAGPTAPAVDVFALGGLLAFAATGRLVFGDGAPAALAYRIVHDEPDLDGVEEPLRALLARCLAKDPARRPTAPELMAAFRGGDEAMGALNQNIDTHATDESGDGDGDLPPTKVEGLDDAAETSGRRIPRKLAAVAAAAVVLIIAAAVTLGWDGGGGKPAGAAGGGASSHGTPTPSGSTPSVSPTPSPTPSSSSPSPAPSATTPKPSPDSASVSSSGGVTVPGPGGSPIRTTTVVGPVTTTTPPAHPVTTTPHTTAPAPPPTAPAPAVYLLRPAPNTTGVARCLGTDGTAISILTDCTGNTSRWKIHQSGGSIQLESAYVPGQCLHSDQWNQLFTTQLSLATCAGTSDGSQWFTEQAAGGGYVQIHNTAPGQGGPPQDTCLRTSPVSTSTVASIDGCGTIPEEQWLVGTS
jgi:serine/threonine protein kinase